MENQGKGPTGKALVIVDLQRDFLPGGAMSVPGGDDIVTRINDYLGVFQTKGLPVFAARDWHPQRTVHFREGGGQCPRHCVQGTEGAEFPTELHLPGSAMVVTKGLEGEGYSVFDGTVGDIGFADMARALGVSELFVCGLATERSVKLTVRDACREGFGVSVLIDAIRGFEAVPGDSALAVADMVRAGARLTALPQTMAEMGMVEGHARVHGGSKTAVESLQPARA
jgi:nicotinamidase/pyrazinamidase